MNEHDTQLKFVKACQDDCLSAVQNLDDGNLAPSIKVLGTLCALKSHSHTVLPVLFEQLNTSDLAHVFDGVGTHRSQYDKQSLEWLLHLSHRFHDDILIETAIQNLGAGFCLMWECIDFETAPHMFDNSSSWPSIFITPKGIALTEAFVRKHKEIAFVLLSDFCVHSDDPTGADIKEALLVHCQQMNENIPLEMVEWLAPSEGMLSEKSAKALFFNARAHSNIETLERSFKELARPLLKVYALISLKRNWSNGFEYCVSEVIDKDEWIELLNAFPETSENHWEEETKQYITERVQSENDKERLLQHIQPYLNKTETSEEKRKI